MMDCLVSTKCFVKIILHSLKYPYSTVNGLILGQKKKGKDCYDLTDCVPLFHMGHGLAPCMEIALNLVCDHCKENDLSIVAYYQANKDYTDSTPDVFACKVAEKLWEINNDTVIMMVNSFGANFLKENANNSSLGEILNVFSFIDGKWKQKSSANIEKPDKSLELLRKAAFVKKLHLNLVDFDNHLDDISNDWHNRMIDSAIEAEDS
ncbi:ER membrane protein complex subunit 8/9 [Brevipalpus obovatus]|uniref:ER membrane protein complex subunit 8/9 n=1 Tax=Brevipalpus obovatus TaxID=246614 RepID=UPI003D9E9DB2